MAIQILGSNACALYGTTESHLLDQGEARAAVAQLGYHSAFTLARPYKDMKAAGGTTAHVPLRLAMEILIDIDHPLPSGELPYDWLAIFMPFQGVQVVVVMVTAAVMLVIVIVLVRGVAPILTKMKSNIFLYIFSIF